MTPAVFTIPAHRGFADALAAGLVAKFGREKTGLARGIVLTPNNRAARAIQDAFVRRSGGGLLLPRLVPVGDPELDERLGGALEPMDGEPIPPAVDPIERQFLLAGLIGRARGVGAAEAVRLAGDLGRTLDQLLVEEIPPARLAGFAGEFPDLARHWERSLDQLRVILDEWPDVLKAMGRIDLAERRNRLLDAATRRWRASPPSGFICAAGINTSAPAVARLLRAIADLPEGLVVLPALDLLMPAEEWDALGPHDQDPETGRRRASIETHPQFHLKLLLDRMGVARGEVRGWRWGGGRDAPAARGRAVGHAMAPPAFTDRWEKLPPRERRLSGVRALELADPAEEAQAIALALREALEEPGRTAALVTPDRGLARRVSAHLRRWGVAADDSAGRPLSETPPGTLLLALANAAADRFAPVALLALLKHPLVRAGDERLDWLEGARQLDLALRGPRPAAGLEGIALHLRAGDEREARKRLAALPWWSDVAVLLRPLEDAFRSPGELRPFLAAIREAAARVAGEAVWSGPAGRAAAELFARVEDSADKGPAPIDPVELPALLEQLLAGEAVRPPYGQHPRLFIWGLIEARLQRADLMVLGGLNEGVWPALPLPDPWLAPKLRAELGLPSLERRIGLAAHDFATALGAPRVLVTRARRDSRSPTIASRFWLRLEAMTGGVSRAPQLAAWAKAIDKPEGEPKPEGRPHPSPEERPKRLSVTEVDRLRADPFAFYARRILGLSSLDPVDAEPTAAWRGTAVHKVLEEWAEHDECDPEKLAARAKALLADPGVHPLLRALWQPRLMEAVAFIAEEMGRNLAGGRRPLKAEIGGEAELAGITLSGKADRIDRLADGTLAIVDYKTGQPPSRKAVMEGFSLQLGLLGLIAEAGGFEDVAGAASCFEYWSLARKAGRLGFVSTPLGGPEQIDAGDFLDRAQARFTEAAAKWLNGSEPFTAKVKPEYSFPEYDQLMRLEEWYGRE